MLSPKEGLISDRRQVLHFQPHCYEHWSQTLGVTVEELLVCFPMQPWQRWYGLPSPIPPPRMIEVQVR